MTKKAFVLLSGGLDSTTCLYQAIKDFMPESMEYEDAINAPIQVEWVEAISINYGQRHLKEASYAQALCHNLGIKHTTLNLSAILAGSGMLTDMSIEVPNIDYADIKGVSPTYVAFRNGLMLSAIAAHAQKWVNEQVKERAEVMLQEQDIKFPDVAEEVASKMFSAGIYFGAHSEDAHNWAYPDCTPEFIGAMANAIYVGTYHAIRLHTPLQWLSKAGVVTLGDSLGVPFEATWSCYKGEELHCGVCPTCRSRRQAFDLAHVVDPTVYKE